VSAPQRPTWCSGSLTHRPMAERSRSCKLEGCSAVWLVENKIDLAVDKVDKAVRSLNRNELNSWISVSAHKGAGVDELSGSLRLMPKDYFPVRTEALSPAARHRARARRNVAALDRALAEGELPARGADRRGIAIRGDDARPADGAGRCRRYFGRHLSAIFVLVNDSLTSNRRRVSRETPTF
jgi:hypothetical protein